MNCYKNKIVCPYCKYELSDYESKKAFGFVGDDDMEMACKSCAKEYQVERETVAYYTIWEKAELDEEQQK